jgi:hypothetical protein
MIRQSIVGVALGLSLTVGVAGVVLGATNPAGTGQPGVDCETVRPGHADAAPGSAFNEDGNAGDHYAGEQPQNSNNDHSVSQYDVACFQAESNH